MSDLFADLLGFVDTEQLAYTEEAREGLNRGRLVQGNPELEKNAQFNQTVFYLGGIGLSADGLSEETMKQGSTITINGKDFVTFQSLEVVVLASSRNRRFYAEIDGNNRLACGTNQDGANAKGWNGIACKACDYYPKNFTGDKKDSCQANVSALVYIPSLDHVAILSFHGASYMEATGWLDQVSKLSRAFAQKPEVQARTPGLARVNSFFFRTTLSAGAYEKGDNNNQFQRLQYTKAEQPYAWETLLNTPETLARVRELWADLEAVWKPMYVDHNPNAVMSLPTAEAAAALPAQSSAPAAPDRQIESKVTVETTAQPAAPAQQVAQQVAQSIQPQQPAPVQQQAAPVVPGVVESQIALDDVDPLPPVNTVMSF